jgi:hypothetical protein
MLGVFGTCSHAGDSISDESRDAFTDRRYTNSRFEVVQALRSKYRRYGVVWSGGAASRFSDRLRPRPTRSRWQRDGDNSIRCEGIDAFKRRRFFEE